MCGSMVDIQSLTAEISRGKRRRRRRRENLRAQAEAFMPASSNHFTVLFLAKILRTKTRYDFRFLATMP